MQLGFQTRVAITGSTGFLGSHLVGALLESGYKVRALIRPHHNLDDDTTSVEWVRGSLDQRAALESLVTGADYVIHLAGVVKGTHYDEFAGANVSGTGHLIDAIQVAAPKAKLLLVSSLAARHPELSHYACSKRSGEIVLENSVLPGWTIFRPTAIYGPGDSELLPLFRIIAKGVKPVLGAEKSKLSLLYVEDMLSAIKAWLVHSSQALGKCYELADSHQGSYSWAQIGNMINAEAGTKLAVKVPVSSQALLVASKINSFCARWLRYQPMLTPGKVREIMHPDWSCDLQNIDRDLGWTPEYPLAKGLQESLSWK